MKRSVYLITAFSLMSLISYQRCHAEVFILTGQITNGRSLFSNLGDGTWLGSGEPLGGYPVPFIAKLNLGAGSDWNFEFTTTDATESKWHQVGGPQVVTVRPDLMTNAVFHNADHISISFIDRPLHFEIFDLNIDFRSQQGTWEWERNCPVCDLSVPLPAAAAVITGIEVVPEPHAATLAAIAITVLFTRRHFS